MTSCAVISAFIAQPTTRQVDDGDDVEPSFGGPDVGEIGDPLLVRRGGLEGAIEEVVRARGSRASILGQPATSRPGPQPVLPHQPLDTKQAATQTLRQHIVPDTPGATGAVACS